MTTAVPLWDRTDPYRCMCGDTYQPQLNARGVLVKKDDPAWSMKEDIRDANCLQRHTRELAKAYRCGIQHHRYSKSAAPGYPDCHLWCPLRPDGGGGSAYVELKRMGENPTAVQVQVMAEVQDATPSRRVYLARPCCLLTGALDRMMADLSGRRCLDIRDGRAHPAVEIPADAPVQPSAPRPAYPRREIRYAHAAPSLPGVDPEPFQEAVGYLIPAPDGTSGNAAAIAAVEAWLRAAGFPPSSYPYPIRLIVESLERGRPRLVHVHCRVGLARAGSDQRVWRQGVAVDDFPHHRADALRCDAMHNLSSQKVAWLIEAATPMATLYLQGSDR